MFITLLDISENKEIGKIIIDNFSKNSVIPVVEGHKRFGLKLSRVVSVFDCEDKLVIETECDVGMEDGTYESVVYSLTDNGSLSFVGIVRQMESLIQEEWGSLIIVEAAKGISLNSKGVSHANSLIASGKVDRDSSWSFSSEDGNTLLGNNNWSNYGKWFLGIRPGTKPDVKEHYAYPFGKGGKIYRRAVIAIKSRSAQQGHTRINAAASRLLDKIDKNKK